MNIFPIQNDDSLVLALKRMYELWNAEPGTPDGDELDAWADLIEEYEAKHHAIPQGTKHHHPPQNEQTQLGERPMMETALVFDTGGRILHWHEPAGRSSGSLPDSRGLWEVLWEHRAKEKGGTGRLGGVAHTHPWRGRAWPSGTDISTFRAVEQGLGQVLLWPVVTFTDVLCLRWEALSQVYISVPLPRLEGLEELRERSRLT
mgnify:CR=1 FL=1